MRIARIPFAAALCLVMLMLSTVSPDAARTNVEDGESVRNIIVVISDGTGYNQIEMAEMYLYGKTGKFPFTNFPVVVGMSTNSLATGDYQPDKAWNDFAWLSGTSATPTDSAAAGSAMATGVKAVNGAISMDSENRGLKTSLEMAEDLGKSTGVITTTVFIDATPAAFTTHSASRRNRHQIAYDLLTRSGVDVVMGTGHPFYDNDGRNSGQPDYTFVGDESLWNKIMKGKAGADADGDGKPDPWSLVEEKRDFKNLMSGETPKRVLGVVQARTAVQWLRKGTDDNIDDDLPYQVERTARLPTLVEMTRAAINVLDDNPKGFFLMVESEGVDETAHAHWAGRTIEEIVEINEAVEAAIEWIEDNSNWEETILIVTGDHETGLLTGPGSNPAVKPLLNRGKNKIPGHEWHTGGHSNSLVPVFVKGKYAELLLEYADQADPVRGNYIDNTEFGQFLFRLLEMSLKQKLTN